MKRFLLIPFFLIFFSATFSQQSNYQPAKIVLESGDTLIGFVSNASLNKIYNEIRFRKSENEDFTTINAKEVLRLSLSDHDVFESHLVKYDAESQQTRTLPITKDPQKWAEDRIFLEVVAQGDSVSLLMFEDTDGRIHFFLKDKGRITELLRRSFVVGENEIRENKKYIGQLRSTFLDCPDAIIKDNLKYDRASLLAVFNKYFICKGSKTMQADPDKGVTIYLGLVVDFFYETRRHDAVKNGIYGKQAFNTGGISPGISLEVRSKKPYKKLSFYHELHYKSQSEADVSFEESSLELLILPRFNYTLGSGTKLYWNTGFTFSYIFHRDMGMFFLPRSNFLGNAAFVTGLGWRAIKSERVEMSLECRGKIRVPGDGDPNASVGLVVSILPKFR